MISALKFTKLKGLTLHVSFKDILSKQEFRYSKKFEKRPSDIERAIYLREVLAKTGCDIMLIVPLKLI